MSDTAEHCPEHEERTICVAKLKTDFKNFSTTLNWLVVLAVCVLGVQWTILWKIDDKLDAALLKQTEVVTELKDLKEHATYKIQQMTEERRSWRSKNP
jgi:hypothetical protein